MKRLFMEPLYQTTSKAKASIEAGSSRSIDSISTSSPFNATTAFARSRTGR